VHGHLWAARRLGWKGPALLWSGPKEKAPPCPPYAPNVLYQGNADLVAPNECSACTCGPPTGSCALPMHMTAYRSTISCMDSPEAFPFDPPPNWDGSCVAAGPIPANTFNTFVKESLRLTEIGCSPEVATPALTGPPTSWQAYALACYGQVSSCMNGEVCFPTADPIPNGFGLCILHDGVEQCPDAYPHQHIFYDGVDDKRSCSPCECGPPVGSECLAWVNVYQDSACMLCFSCGTLGLNSPRRCSVSPDPDPPLEPFPLGSMSATMPIVTVHGSDRTWLSVIG
jgi:hypothetical protein